MSCCKEFNYYFKDVYYQKRIFQYNIFFHQCREIDIEVKYDTIFNMFYINA